MEISQLALASTTLLAEPATSAPARPEGLGAAAERFAALMDAGSAPPATAAAGASGLIVPPPGEGSSLGDAILGSMRDVSSAFSQRWGEVEALVSQDLTSVHDLMRVQISLTQAAIQYDVLGKAISKSTQNFDQLVRLQ